MKKPKEREDEREWERRKREDERARGNKKAGKEGH